MSGRTRVSKTLYCLDERKAPTAVDIAVSMREVLAMPWILKPWILPWVVSISFPEAAILLDKSNGVFEDETGVVLASARRRF